MAVAGAAAARCLKARLRADPTLRLYGAFLMGGCPLTAELMGRAGYEFLVVDMEHSPVETHSALPMLQAVAAGGSHALLRVALNRPELIKKALDLGPDGLVVPLVDSAEDARAAVQACRYPPAGVRGVAHTVVRASHWGLDTSYAAESEARQLLLCQVESAAGVEAASDILAVDGVDGVFVGPLDLSASLGHLNDVRHEEVRSAIERVEATAKRHPDKVLAGFAGCRTPAEMFRVGYHLVAGTADMALLRSAAKADVDAARAAREEGEPSAAKRLKAGVILRSAAVDAARAAREEGEPSAAKRLKA